MIGSVSADRLSRHRRQPAEVSRNNDRDESPQQQDEFALRDQIRLAGFVDQFRNFAHGAMHRQVFQPHKDRHAKAEPEQAEQDSDQQQFVAIDGANEEADLRKVGQLQGSFAADGFAGRLSKGGDGAAR